MSGLLRGGGEGLGRRVTAKGCSVSFWGYYSGLKLAVMKVVHIFEFTKKKKNPLNCTNRWMLLYVHYISIKLLKKSGANESSDIEQAIFQIVVLESERWVGLGWKLEAGSLAGLLWVAQALRGFGAVKGGESLTLQVCLIWSRQKVWAGHGSNESEGG